MSWMILTQMNRGGIERGIVTLFAVAIDAKFDPTLIVQGLHRVLLRMQIVAAGGGGFGGFGGGSFGGGGASGSW